MNSDRKPNNYLDAINLLDEILDSKTKAEIKECTEFEAGHIFHFSLGQWIRNNWILDKSSPLGQQILNDGPGQIDAYSSVIVILYHKHLNGKPFNIEEEVKKADWLKG